MKTKCPNCGETLTIKAKKTKSSAKTSNFGKVKRDTTKGGAIVKVNKINGL